MYQVRLWLNLISGLRRAKGKTMNFAKHVKVREEKFGSVIFETLREKVYVTNETGSDILRLIKEGKDKEGIVRNLHNAYQVDVNHIDNEVTSFVNLLKEKELVIE